MRFSNAESSKRGGIVTATASSKLLAVRFASIALAAVLAASFMPVAAFADEGESADSEGVQDQPAQTEQEQQGDQPVASVVDDGSVDEGEPADEGLQNSSGQQTEGVQQTDGTKQGEWPAASTSEPAEAEGDQNLSTQSDPPPGDIRVTESCNMKPGGYILLDNSQYARDYPDYEFRYIQTTVYESPTSSELERQTMVPPGGIEHGNAEGNIVLCAIGSKRRENCEVLAKNPGFATVIVTFDADPSSGSSAHLYVIYKIEVSPYQITLTPKSGSYTYDGTEKSVSGFETLEFEVEGSTYTVEGLTAEAKGTDAGEYPVEVTGDAVVTDSDDNVVTGWCELRYADAKLVIEKRPVTLTSAGASKEYDGTPLTNETVTVGGDGWAAGDSVTCVATGSQTDAGTSKNSIDVKFATGSAENYNITKDEGDLVVEKRAMTLKSTDLSKEFDGTSLTNGAAPIEGENFADGQGATYSFTGSQKIVGSSENAFECIPNEGTNLDNYQINKTYGTLTVTDRSEKYQITLIPNSKSETFDGTEKSVSGFETMEFEVEGSTYTVGGLTAEAKGTDAGEYPVEVTGDAVVTDADGNDVTSQFDVAIDDAKLTIVKDDPAPVDPDKPSSDTPSKTTGKATAAKAAAKPASKSAKTGDGIALYAMGICGVAIAAGAVAFVARRKRNRCK